MGTAYLFTHEAVSTGAILEGFQLQARNCRSTVLLDAGGGHAVRCAPTPFAAEFNELKHRLSLEGVPPDAVRTRLETLNVGRLRIASKGTVRTANGEDAPSRLVEVDSERQRVEGMYMLGQVAALRHEPIAISELHRDVSEGAAEVLRDRLGVLGITAEPRARAAAPPPAIAIVGMACVFPGAESADELWRNILANHDATREVAPERWRADLLYDSDPAAPDRVVSKWGGFVDPVAVDPIRYGIPPASFAAVEPMHLLMLEMARRALADAGYDRRPFRRERTAVIVGTAGSPWDLGTAYETRCMVEHFLDRAAGVSEDVRREAIAAVRSVIPPVTEDSFPGILGNVAAGRIANRLDLGGPNYTVDAACAASLAALDCAARELREGTSDVVVLGGLEGQQSAFGFLLFSKTQALSPRGRCRPFDAAADGTTISEGAAALILKRLDDAVRDGDRIYAVVRSVGSSSDGRDRSLTAPSVKGQRRALERAYGQLEFGPEGVGLVEAHGTGTVVGDRAEFETLREVFEGSGARPQSCALGSIKSQIGHTKNAAGLAGLIKVSRALHHRMLPPTLVDEPSEVARDRGAVLYLNTRSRPWIEHRDQPRRAAVSSFGFGGTNFHAVLEEYPSHAAPNPDRPAELLFFRGADRLSVAADLDRVATALEAGAAPRLTELAAALARAASAREGGCRLAVLARTVADLAPRLDAMARIVRSSDAAGGDHFWISDGGPDPGPIALLFPGQGSQHPDMLAEAVCAFPVVAEVIESADRLLVATLERPLSSFIFPPPAYSPEEEIEQRRELDQTCLAQPALGATEVALLRLLERLGLSPDMVAGHSYGEYVALHAAGSLSFEELMVLSERRGRVVQETQGRGRIAMVAVASSEQVLTPLLADAAGVSFAGCNAPEQTIVGGTVEAIEGWLPALDREGIAYRRLSLSAGFHIPEASSAAERFGRELGRFELRAPRIPVFANLDGRPYPDEPREMRRILIDQLRHPVRFRDQVAAMLSAGARTFLEVGPGRVLSGLARATLSSGTARVLATDRGGGLEGLLRVVGELYAGGRTLEIDALFEGLGEVGRSLDEILAPLEAAAATAWLVDGGSARPPAGRAAPAAARQPGDTDEAALKLPSEEARPPAPMTSSPAGAGASDGDGSVVQALQAVMNRFLDYQRTAVEQRQRLMEQVVEAQRRLAAWRPGDGTPDATLPTVRERPEAPEQPPTPTPPAPMVSPPPPPEPAAKERTAAPAQDVESILLDVVCERTGYPREMLEPDLDLEGDLGIDSIKRTEIFGRVRERLGLTEEVLSAEDFFLATSRLRTLREAVGWLSRSSPTAAAQDVPRVAVTDSGVAPPPIRRYVVVPRPAPLTAGERPRTSTEEVILITEDREGRARSAMTALKTAGFVPALVRHSETTRVVAPGEYEADLLSRPALQQLRAWIVERHGPVTALCHLLPLTTDPSAGGRSDCAELRSLLRLTSTFGPEIREAAGTVTAVAPLDGAFGANGAPTTFQAGAAAITGFLRSLGREWPEVRFKALRVDPATNQESLLAQLLAETTRDDPALEVGYSSGERVVLDTAEAAVEEAAEPSLSLDEDSVILVTGGVRGISAQVSLALAERFHPRLILVGRSPVGGPEDGETAALESESELKRILVGRCRRRGEHVTPAAVEEQYRRLMRDRERRCTLERLAELAPLVELHPLDVRDDGRFADLIESIYGRFGRLDGVIHGAGVVDDHLLLSKADRAFDEVFDTKVRGALTLARTLRPEGLRFLVFFSSVAARYGYAGGTDYAAANDVLNRLAWVLDRSWPGRVVSIGWGPWDEVGIAARYPEELHVRQGLYRIPPAVGREHFLRELLHGTKGEAEVLIFGSRGGEPYAEAPAGGAARAHGE
jgi:acyl transferase domain-containing protein/NAD(P)-dependent dehydrogenase (short-subunit alcohol dehydrogenase family)